MRRDQVATMAEDERTPVVAGKGPAPAGRKFRLEFNLEMLRVSGLCALTAMFYTGLFVSRIFVNYPPKETPSAWTDKLFFRAPSDFETTESFTYKLFRITHTCLMLVHDPAKTVTACMIMFFEIPICLFVVCNYLRVQLEEDPAYDRLKAASKIFAPIQFLGICWVYMMFVNAPDGEFNTPRGNRKYAMHYVAFLGYQMAMTLMAVQQAWYTSVSKDMPYLWMASGRIRWYLCILITTQLLYMSTIMSCILPYSDGGFTGPWLDTTVLWKELLVRGWMYAWLACTLGVPLVYGVQKLKDGFPDCAVEFSMKEKEQ